MPPRHMGGGGRAVAILSGLALLARPTPADASDTKSDSDALFYEGNTLMAQGNAVEACKKFEQSLALMRRGGSLLNLALCHEAAGKLATALPLFVEALQIAGQDGHADRQEIAREHIDALRPKLPWITVSPTAEPPGLEITIDGVALPRARWGSPTPVDPGAHVVIATAPGASGSRPA